MQGLIARTLRPHRLPHVGDLAVQKCHFDLLVNVDLLGAYVEDSFWGAHVRQFSLHIRNFAVQESYLHVFVDIELLGTQIDDLLRFS